MIKSLQELYTHTTAPSSLPALGPWCIIKKYTGSNLHTKKSDWLTFPFQWCFLLNSDIPLYLGQYCEKTQSISTGKINTWDSGNWTNNWSPKALIYRFFKWWGRIQIQLSATWASYCGRRMRWECWEHFPSHRGLATPTCIRAHAWRTCRHACWVPQLALSFQVGGRENVPGIPGACATRNFSYLVRLGPKPVSPNDGKCKCVVLFTSKKPASKELNYRFPQ